MEKNIIIASASEMIELGEVIGKLLQENDILALSGDLGAGKTTLTKGIAKGLEIKEIVNSPTFTIMKIYNGRIRLYHLDVYRIENASEDFELTEYFEDDGVCVIEWATNISELLPEKLLLIEINDLGNNERLIKFIDKTGYYQRILDGVK
jgi:tRNA threonylcarbamoyladenosine biosynthesis protein TsaE